MLRNREIRIFLLVMSCLSLGFVLAEAFCPFSTMLLLIFSSVSLIGCSFFFTRRRYCEIEKLTAYLRQIIAGKYSLDVRDNQEGELSILKNEIYKVTQMLSERSSNLQQDKQQLTDAISDISHQLKTPLTSMTMMTDLLRDANLPLNKRIEFTRKIRVQLERVEWLVSSLLKLAKIDAGTIQFNREPVVVKKLIDKALQPLLIPIDIKGQSISVYGEDSVTFPGDLNWTAEAVMNIIKNCVEHTPHGGALVISFTENALYTEIAISDNGRGIAREDIPHIFQRFYKGKNAGKGSTGIGLAMSHSIITSQNGDLEVESRENEGTIFRIKFYRQRV